MATEKKSNLAAKLANVMAEVGHVQKRGKNEQQNYKFLQESDIKAALQPHLAKAGIACLVGVNYCDVVPFGRTKSGSDVWMTKVQIALTFIDSESGEREAVTGFGTGVDTQDKGLAKAVTMAVKGILSHSFLIPTGDDPERDERDHESNADSKRQAVQAERGAAHGVEGDPVEMFLTADKVQEKEGKNGKPWYIIDAVSDSGEAHEVRVFGRAVALIKQVREGHAFKVVGKWAEFNGNTYIGADKLQGVAPVAAGAATVTSDDVPF